MGKAGRKWTRWSRGMREAFFDHLAGTCSVKESAARAGVPVISVYAQRRKDPSFAAEWHEALLAGYEALETALVGRALGTGAAEGVDTGLGAIDVETALRLLSAHRNALHGKHRGGPSLKQATRDDTDRAILKKLDAMARAAATRALPAPERTGGEAPATALPCRG